MPDEDVVSEFFSRNFPYLIDFEQQSLRDTTILVAGLGIGSVICEGLVRLGVGRLILLDGDRVEESNLNRQNYTTDDVGMYKADALARYLRRIGGHTQIDASAEWFEAGNADEFVRQADLAINTIDFDHPMCLGMNEVCKRHAVPMLFPMNFGWASVLMVFSHSTGNAPDLGAWFSTDVSLTDAESIARHLVVDLVKRNSLPDWWLEVWTRYKSLSPENEPQLHVGACLLSASVSSVVYDWRRGNVLPEFPSVIFMNSRQYSTGRVTILGRLKAWLVRRRLAAQ